MKHVKDRVLLALGVALSGLFLWLALSATDLPGLADALARTNGLWVLGFLGLYAAFFVLKAMRWRLLLLPLRDTTARELGGAVMVGAMANNLLPAQLGELVRMAFLAKRLDLAGAKVLATIALERMLDFLAVLLFLSLALLTSEDTPDVLVTAGWFVGGAGVAILGCAVLWVGWTERVTAVVRRLAALLPGGLGARIAAELEHSAEGLAALRQPRLVAGAAALSVVQWACMSLGTAATVAAVGVSVPFAAGFVIVAVTVAGLVLPSSPGYVGTTQLCFALALAPFDVSSDDAVAASIVFNAACWLPVTLAGLVVLWRSKMSLRALLGLARAEPH